MEQIKIENLSFSYPLEDKKALNNVNLSVEEGEFVLLCGKSGCGKTTLLKQIKKELSPHGKRDGRILFKSKEIDKLTLRESAGNIGYVMQNPDLQIVTDKVWHELAFGLENLGLSRDEIRLRTAEMASYFGINEWFQKKTTELSGGQKQILNLACVMVMCPQVLLLDEPTAQLDPISAERFLQTLGKINRELGTTIILTEQRLEEAFTYADRVLIMDNGEICFDATPRAVGERLKEMPRFLQNAAPTAMRLFSYENGGGECPLNVREARKWLSRTKHKNKIEAEEIQSKKEMAVELKNVSFRYDKNGNDVLKNLSLKIPEKDFFAILGGNSVGKTTLLKIISGILCPYEGKIKIFNKKQSKNKLLTALLPQDVQLLFTSKTVLLDLKQVESDVEKINEIARLTKIEHILNKHPFDLSGGEQQRAALAKVLLCEGEILLLDEPTKGMDAEFKGEFAKIIRKIKEAGKTVVMVSHDIEFCAKYADNCAMLFDGEVCASAPTRKFFCENRFYTTAANRISRGIINNAITDEDIYKCIKEK